jgi:hypothetical protein
MLTMGPQERRLLAPTVVQRSRNRRDVEQAKSRGTTWIGKTDTEHQFQHAILAGNSERVERGRTIQRREPLAILNFYGRSALVYSL